MSAGLGGGKHRCLMGSLAASGYVLGCVIPDAQSQTLLALGTQPEPALATSFLTLLTSIGHSLSLSLTTNRPRFDDRRSPRMDRHHQRSRSANRRSRGHSGYPQPW